MTTIVKGDGQKKGRQPEKPRERDFVVVVEQNGGTFHTYREEAITKHFIFQ